MPVGAVYSKSDEESFYWLRAFEKRGMTLAHAESLAFESRCDRHQILLALEQGCRPELAYEIFS